MSPRTPPGRRSATPAIIVLAKAPVHGRVKTRCCPPCTPGQAAELAEAALADTLRVATACGAGRRVLALDGEPGPWIPAGWDVVAQRGDRLGERIEHAFAATGGPALLIGMDTPQVTAGLLDMALRGIRRDRAVLGPAADGGFWAVGLAAPIDGLFRDVAMSRSDTCRSQEASFADHGLGWRALPVLEDVDDFETALAVARDAPETAFAAAVRKISASLQLQFHPLSRG